MLWARAHAGSSRQRCALRCSRHHRTFVEKTTSASPAVPTSTPAAAIPSAKTAHHTSPVSRGETYADLAKRASLCCTPTIPRAGATLAAFVPSPSRGGGDGGSSAGSRGRALPSSGSGDSGGGERTAPSGHGVTGSIAGSRGSGVPESISGGGEAEPELKRGRSPRGSSSAWLSSGALRFSEPPLSLATPVATNEEEVERGRGLVRWHVAQDSME